MPVLELTAREYSTLTTVFSSTFKLPVVDPLKRFKEKAPREFMVFLESIVLRKAGEFGVSPHGFLQDLWLMLIHPNVFKKYDPSKALDEGDDVEAENLMEDVADVVAQVLNDDKGERSRRKYHYKNIFNKAAKDPEEDALAHSIGRLIYQDKKGFLQEYKNLMKKMSKLSEDDWLK